MKKPLRKNDIKTLSEIEHILQRPGIYIGSVKEESLERFMYVNDKMVKNEIRFIPGLIKIIEEVIDNSIDEGIKTDFEYANHINVSIKDGIITVKDNGRGLPIELDVNGKYVTENIFTKLRTGSNFDDEKRAEVAAKGMNGVGVSLTRVFSEFMHVKTANGIKLYEQKFSLGANSIGVPKIKDSSKNFTEVKFKPNYAYFEASDEFIEILPNIIYRIIQNAAFCFPEIVFKFNNKKVLGSNLKQYLQKLSPVFEYAENEKVRLGIFCSDDGFQHLSFVNGLETSRAGTHVDFITNSVVNKLREFIKKKHKLTVKPADIRNKLFIVMSIRIPAPDFDSQTKERLITSNSLFSDSITDILTDKFFKRIIKNEDIIEPIVEAYRLKQQVEENLKLKKISKQTATKVRVAKYLPATKKREYLFLCEGDSAMGGLSASLGRENYSYFPLRGKPLNAYEAKLSNIAKNEEFKNVVKITGMRLDKDVQTNLRYQNIIMAMDQDYDGVHIKALLLAFFGRFSKSMIQTGKIHFLRTPLITLKKQKKIIGYFFDFQEYNKVKDDSKYKGAQITYYKGLGTWDSKDLKSLIEKDGIDHFIVTLAWDDDSDQAIKEWIGGNADLRKPHLKGKTFSFDAV